MKKMNRKLFSAVIVIVVSLMIVGVASALSAGNVDGVWGNIDGVTAGPSTLDVIGGATTSGSSNTLYPPQTDQRMERLASVCRGDADGSTTYEGWTRTTGTPSWGDLGSYNGCTTATGLFFSEYLYDQRGSAADYIGIEIYNGTGAAVNLGNFSLRLFSGGLNNWDTVALNSVSLAAGDVYVLVSSSATGQTGNEDQVFTGNDDYRAISLYNENETAGARCNRWATVPTGTLNIPTALSSGDKGVQTGSTSDENQVRYGRDAFYPSNWQSLSCDLTNFAQQSGFGFDGVNSVASLVPNTPFYLGFFTHYNNQVFSTDDSGASTTANQLLEVPLTISIPFVCNTTPPTPPVTTTYTWTPTFTLDETSNSAGTCVYPGTSICPDKVTVTEPTGTTFNCPDGTYTVVINGFTTLNAAGGPDCSLSYNPASVATEFITQEDTDNHACLWASITAPTADIGPTKTCQKGGDGFVDTYKIVTTNVGPGAAVNPTLTDTLPSGVTYAGYTSKLYNAANPTGINQGSCSYNTTTTTITCQLLTPLVPYLGDPSSRWEVVIDVTKKLTGDYFTNTATVTSITTDPNTSNNSSTTECAATAVTLTSFTATSVEGGVVLDWETASEYQTLGFNLYWSDTLEGEKVLVNAELIPTNVAPGSLRGAVYSYTDTVSAAGEYFYWLEEVEINTHASVYGPVVVIFK